jgi:hypothetical protein
VYGVYQTGSHGIFHGGKQMNIPSKYQTRSLKFSYRAGYADGFYRSQNRVSLRGPDNREAYQHGYENGLKKAERKRKGKEAA